MSSNPFDLLTAVEAEVEFGSKYFYRQRIYRLVERGQLHSFQFRGKTCFLGHVILKLFLENLEAIINQNFPELKSKNMRVFYDNVSRKRIVIDGLFGKSIHINTEQETEEDAINKIKTILEYEGAYSEQEPIEDLSDITVLASFEEGNPNSTKDSLVPERQVLPEEIFWVRVDTKTIEDVEIKSQILVSLPSIAQFVGVRTDNFTSWIKRTSFIDYILSAHFKQFQGTEKSVPWKKGIVSGLLPLIPFELLPEIIIALKQSSLAPIYPEKTEMLYNLAKTTLQSVGIAISGDKDKAAEELAKVSRGLGISAADQVIAIFKQYESREFQIQTTKEFSSKLKEIGADYAVTTGRLTFGITGKYTSQWKALGISKKLPSKFTTSSREVMRQLSPSDSVGITFGERHFIKDQNVDEAIETGKQGKSFYERLKNVGLLDNRDSTTLEEPKQS